MQPSAESALWPLAVYGAAAAATIALMLGLSSLLGQRHRERATNEPYESGVAATGKARIRFPVKFYLTAVFFLIFDLEAAYLYAWAISVRESGWAGFIEVLVFILVLVASLIYLWRRGALEWRTTTPPGGRDDAETR